MVEAGYLLEVIVVLLAAVVSTLLFQRLGLGTVLGYIVAGTVIGPAGLGLVSEGETIHALAELGIVFLLFTVGLELPVERIKLLFWRTFALGAGQILLTGLAVAGIALLAGIAGPAAAVIGGALALSSTAIVLRMLSDRGELTTQFGRNAFGVLLVQDLAVAPFLVWVLALGQTQLALPAAIAIALLKMLVAVVVILGLGRVMLRHLVWQVASLREPEIFAALTLFVAGMLLAGTNYRHQVAAEIQPFRGLLLGLFYMTIGMSVDLALALERPGTVALLVLALLLGKALLLAGLARLLGFAWAQSLHLGMLLSQGGEFSFVLLGAALAVGILASADGQLLVLVVTLTMMATPLLARLGRGVEQRAERSSMIPVEEVPEATRSLRDHVVIAGFGRVGTAVAASLESAGVPFIAVDLNPHTIARLLRRRDPARDPRRAPRRAGARRGRRHRQRQGRAHPGGVLDLPLSGAGHLRPGLRRRPRRRAGKGRRPDRRAGAGRDRRQAGRLDPREVMRAGGAV
jgi:CPA2 family monovalent cation:H+ antiporter-2